MRDMQVARTNWQRLFDPLAEIEPGRWEVGDGPAMRLMPHDQDGLMRLVWKVASLERAATFLGEQALLGISSGEQVVLDGTKLDGLDIRLVE